MARKPTVARSLLLSLDRSGVGIRQQDGAKVSAETGSFPPQDFQYAPVAQGVEMDAVTSCRGPGVPAQRHDHGGSVCDQICEVLVR